MTVKDLPKGTQLPLEVTLPTCPVCLHTGKIPSAPSRRDFCTGGLKSPHRSTKMVDRLFKEVLDPDQKGR